MVAISEKQNNKVHQVQVQEQTQDCCGPIPVTMPEGTDEQVKLMAALSDTTRLQIVAMLAQQEEPLCVCEIQGHFNLGQPTISHHLRVLRDARLVSWEKCGLWVYYSLNHQTLERATAYLNNLLSLSTSALANG